MKEMANRQWIKLKGGLFLIVGIVSSTLLLLDHLDARTAVLLAISVWSFCRFYYFAFYVIERYVDPGYHFAGLWSFARYAVGRSRPVSRRHSSTHQQSR